MRIGLFAELLREPGCGGVLAEVLSSRVRVALPGEVSQGLFQQGHPCGSCAGAVTGLFVRAVCFGGRAAVFVLCLISLVYPVDTFYSECLLCGRALT